MNYNYALAAHISAQYDKVKDKSFEPRSLKRELADELIDMVDSEIFAGALYELITASFRSTIVNYLVDELDSRMQKQRRKSSAALLVVPTASDQATPMVEEKQIAIVQLTTVFYQLQNSDMIQG